MYPPVTSQTHKSSSKSFPFQPPQPRVGAPQYEWRDEHRGAGAVVGGGDGGLPRAGGSYLHLPRAPAPPRLQAAGYGSLPAGPRQHSGLREGDKPPSDGEWATDERSNQSVSNNGWAAKTFRFDWRTNLIP